MNRKRARLFSGTDEGCEIGLNSQENTEVLSVIHQSSRNEKSISSVRVDTFERINDLEFESYDDALAFFKANRMGYV